MALDFGLPSADTPFFNADTGLVSEAWYTYLANLFEAINSGVVGTSNEVLHGGGAGYSAVAAADLAKSAAGNLLVAQGVTLPVAYRAMSGDATMVSTGVVTVVQINGAPLGSTTTTAANVLIASGSAWVGRPISGDAAITTTGVVSVTKTNGFPFGPLSTITSGISVTVTTAPLVALGTQGSMTFVSGALTAQVQAT